MDVGAGLNIDDILGLGIRAPGVVQLPVCDGETAWLNWREADLDDENYPCQPITTAKRARVAWYRLKQRGLGMWRRAFSVISGRC